MGDSDVNVKRGGGPIAASPPSFNTDYHTVDCSRNGPFQWNAGPESRQKNWSLLPTRQIPSRLPGRLKLLWITVTESTLPSDGPNAVGPLHGKHATSLLRQK